MNLRQAYDGWSKQEQNRQFYVNTRDAFRRAWFALPTNKPCSWYTKDVLALALAETRVVESDKVKAASVMLHVLTWANFAEPKYNPKPDFKTEDVTRLIHLPADKLEKERQRINAAMLCQPMPEEKADEDNKATATEEPAATPDNDADPLKGIDFDDKQQVAGALMEQSARIMNDKPEEETNMEQKKRQRGKAPKPVAQIDPETLKVIKVWPSRGEAERELGVCNIDRAIKRLQKAGGFYWQYPEDIDTFADRLKQKQDGQQQPKPKAKPKTKGLMEQFEEEYRQFTGQQAVERPDSPKFHIGDRVCNMLPQYAGMVGTVETEGEWLGRTYGYEVKTDNASYRMLESEMMPAPAEQPVSETFTPEPLSTYSDEELMEELDRRGFEGELSRRVVFTIGAK